MVTVGAANHYKDAIQVEDAMKVVASWIARNPRLRVVYHGGTAVDADPDTGVIRIPRTGHLDSETLMRLRVWIHHEAGHIADTNLSRAEFPKPKAHFSILNALEDIGVDFAQGFFIARPESVRDFARFGRGTRRSNLRLA